MSTQIPQILIIDDQPQNLQVLGNMLREAKFKTGFSTNGKNALEILKNNHFDLILLDINMPDMDGFEVCENIRKLPKNIDTPIIFLTAAIDEKSIIKALTAGGQDYVTKPFNSQELLARIHTHLKLQDQKIQLEKFNSNLEDIVKEKTKALIHSAAALETANEKLQLLDTLKNQFIRLISHELRTPLTGVVGFTEILSKDLEDTEYEEKMLLLISSVKRLEKTTIKTLLITELEADEYNYQPKFLHLDSLLKKELASLQNSIAENKLEIVNNIHSKTMINADQELIAFAFNAILENAVEHSNLGGVITLNIELQNKNTIIRIENTGNGFSKQVLSSPLIYFQPNVKFQNNKMGLGLIITELITKRHQGSLVISNKNKTACVEIILPNIDN
ncbi:MAG: two-component system sensor histidine kinase/response regulator [Salibacteraceae bacterium]|jgi:two-component system sensor histidine kinase/response regulator